MESGIRRRAARPSPLVHQRAKPDPEGTFILIERMHRILLVGSLITILGAVAGSHGGLQP